MPEFSWDTEGNKHTRTHTYILNRNNGIVSFCCDEDIFWACKYGFLIIKFGTRCCGVVSCPLELRRKPSQNKVLTGDIVRRLLAIPVFEYVVVFLILNLTGEYTFANFREESNSTQNSRRNVSRPSCSVL